MQAGLNSGGAPPAQNLPPFTNATPCPGSTYDTASMHLTPGPKRSCGTASMQLDPWVLQDTASMHLIPAIGCCRMLGSRRPSGPSE